MTSRSHGAWQESSVAKFGAVHKKLKEEGKDETTRGESLRELQRFFKEHDKDEGYAGLRRIADDDGAAVWTILKETEVATQLEKRAEERREEERLHEKIVSEHFAQAHMLQGLTGASSKEAEVEARLRAELKAEMEANARGAGKGRAVPASEASEALLSGGQNGAPKSSCGRCSLL